MIFPYFEVILHQKTYAVPETSAFSRSRKRLSNIICDEILKGERGAKREREGEGGGEM